MSVSTPFILRPVATSMLMLGLVMLGIFGWSTIPVAPIPEVEYPTLQIRTPYPGAGPEIVESTITVPLEKQLGQISGLTRMSSSSGLGLSLITLQFRLDLDIDVAEQQVQAAINSANNYLPKELPTPPVYYKTNPAEAPILSLALISNSILPFRIQDIVETRMIQKLSQIQGVGVVEYSRGEKPAIHIRVDPTRLAAVGIGLEGLRATLEQSSLKQAKGSLDGKAVALVIEANDQLSSIEDYLQQIIAYKGQGPIRLRDVASVAEEPESLRQGGWVGVQPAIILNIHRQPGANTLQVVENIQKLLPSLTEGLPATIDLKILADRSLSIKASIQKVKEELWLTIFLVVLVIYLFFRNLPATLIPSLSVPISLAGTFAAMKVFGFSLNNLTLMALTIATGFVVDDAIVMLENILRHIESGMKPREAALRGSSEIGFTIVSLTLALLAVLIPLLFMPDILGRLFREFALTLALSIVISALVSLTLTPMLAARLPVSGEPNNSASGMQQSLLSLYGTSLSHTLAHPRAVLGGFSLLMTLTVLLGLLIPKGFFPSQDTGFLIGYSEADPSIGFEAMKEKQQALSEILLKDPDIETLSSQIGIEGRYPALSGGRFLITLKPKEMRSSAETVMARSLKKVKEVPGIRLSLMSIQDLRLEDEIGPSPYQFTISSQDPEDLAFWSQKIHDTLKENQEIGDIWVNNNRKARTLTLDIDRDTASRLGISPRAIIETLYDAFGERQFINRLTQNNQYRVIMELGRAYQDTPDHLEDLYLPQANGKMVPLSTLIHRSESEGPSVIYRTHQQPSATFSFDLSSKETLESGMASIRHSLRSLAMPESIRMEWTGVTLAFSEAFDDEWPLILAAITVIYILLGMLYESYLHPLTILSTLPSAALGGLLMLMIRQQTLDLVSLIGMVLLIGIVAKNAIMMIDFAIVLERDQGMSARDAIHQAATQRLRPILMTTFAALLAALPLAFGGGMGEELRQPLGIVMLGGLLVSQCLTLYTTPAIYVAFSALGRKISQRCPPT